MAVVEAFPPAFSFACENSALCMAAHLAFDFSALCCSAFERHIAPLTQCDRFGCVPSKPLILSPQWQRRRQRFQQITSFGFEWIWICRWNSSYRRRWPWRLSQCEHPIRNRSKLTVHFYMRRFAVGWNTASSFHSMLEHLMELSTLCRVHTTRTRDICHRLRSKFKTEKLRL